MFGRTGRDRGYEFLTIVTFGRSGSTAIQAVINAHPGALIRGENYLALRGLQHYVQSLAAASSRHHAGRPDHPWFGTARLDASAVRDSARRAFVTDVLRPRGDTRWSGYKEVRYETGYFPDSDALLDHLMFVASFLPGIRFVINVRDADRSGASGWWPENPNAAHVLGATVENLRTCASDAIGILGEHRVALIEYEDWSCDPQILTRALTSIGFPAQPDLVARTLATRLDHGHAHE